MMGHPLLLPYRNRHDDHECIAEVCIKAFFGCIIFAGLTALLIWVGVRDFEPICSLRHLQIPAVANSTTKDNTVYFDLKLRNRNQDTGIYYDALNFSVSCSPKGETTSLVPIGNVSLAGFHQHDGGEVARVYGRFVGGDGWREVAAEADGSLGLRVDLKTAIRYEILFWKTKRHRLEVGADVSVGKDGFLIDKKGIFHERGIRLTSAAGVLPEKDSCGRLLTAVLVALVVYLCVW